MRGCVQLIRTESSGGTERVRCVLLSSDARLLWPACLVPRPLPPTLATCATLGEPCRLLAGDGAFQPTGLPLPTFPSALLSALLSAAPFVSAAPRAAEMKPEVSFGAWPPDALSTGLPSTAVSLALTLTVLSC